MATYQQPITRKDAVRAAQDAAASAQDLKAEAYVDANGYVNDSGIKASTLLAAAQLEVSLAQFYIALADFLPANPGPVEVPLDPANVDQARVRYAPESA